ncbi:prolactin [Cricetulus griseus]|uniref:Prolactin n=1 Tax=Cricetulus griseus TaxID=10029 RepID=A0A061IAY0_CRIGR|nr:prolactin [Cricetulus griseus]ERE77693.1 prolactin-like protein [Cricetulus griseus]
MNSHGSDRKAGTLLLLVVSNLLFCRNVHPLPICPGGNCQMPLQELFDRVIMLSHYVYLLSADMFIELDKQYAQDHEFIAKAISDCPTSSLATPEGKEEAQQVPPEVLLNLILSLVHSWNDPLFQLVTEVDGIHEASDAIISRAKEIGEQNKRLLEGIEKILGQAYPAAKGNEFYSVWSQFPSLQGVDEESRDLAIYNKIRCLRRDSHKVDNYLKLLRCRIVHNNNC